MKIPPHLEDEPAFAYGHRYMMNNLGDYGTRSDTGEATPADLESIYGWAMRPTGVGDSAMPTEREAFIAGMLQAVQDYNPSLLSPMPAFFAVVEHFTPLGVET